MPTLNPNRPLTGIKHYAVLLANSLKLGAVYLISAGPFMAGGFIYIDQFSQLTHIIDIKRCFENGAPMILINGLQKKTTRIVWHNPR